MEMIHTKETVEDILYKGVGEFIDPEGKFKEKLLKKIQGEYPEDIIIKFGVDPTRPDIHLGHAAVLRKLRQFQDMGCKVVFLVGDFTVRIGDPTGKSSVRPEIDQQEAENNINTYLDQVGKILKTDENVFSWIRNSDWFYGVTDLTPGPETKTSVHGIDIDPQSFVGKAILFEETRMQKTRLHKQKSISVTFNNILWTLRHITYGRLIQRDMFQERLKKGEELYMHEMMYPVLQGIDSDVIGKVYGVCDLEIGGTDQTFNMLVGRDVMKMNKQESQAVLSIHLLEGTDGKEKMSKSLDNYIGITDDSGEMYGKVMSIPDASIKNYFELCTYTPADEIDNMLEGMEKGKENPRDIKMKLAREIVAIYHGESEAGKAQDAFIAVFQKKDAPADMKEVAVTQGVLLMDILVDNEIVSSKTEYRRLVNERAVRILDDDLWLAVDSPDVTIDKDMKVKVGKRKFISIKIS